MRKFKNGKSLCLMFLIFGFISFWPQQVVADFYVIAAKQKAPPAKTIQVNCDGGQTINQALLKANPGDTIQVQGTCNEAISLIAPNHERLTIDGLGTAIIDGGGQDVITINGVQGVTINGFTVQNGNDGIISRHSSVEVRDTTVQNSTRVGIWIDEISTARFTDCNVTGSGWFGIGVFRTSNAVFGGNITSSGNGSSGITVQFASSALFYNAALTTSSNGQHGILIGATSNLTHENSTVVSQDNAHSGVFVGSVGNLILYTNNTLTANNNAINGLTISKSSSVLTWPNNNTITIQGNNLGILVEQNSSLRGRATTQVTSNIGGGVVADDGSSIDINNSTITGNTGDDVVLKFGSRAILTGGTIGDISCCATLLIMAQFSRKIG